MSVFDDYPNATHIASEGFPYYFDDDHGICWGPCVVELPWKYDYDLAIYYGGMGSDDFIDCRCSRWDVQNYNVIVETWLKKSDLDTLLDNTRVGAVGELYRILGSPHFYDKSWTAANTIKLLPTPSSNYMGTSTLKKMRKETVIYPKNISLHPIDGPGEWHEVKIEGMISSNQDL
jgi:hypothetical protein